jgi:hypothetical protein
MTASLIMQQFITPADVALSDGEWRELLQLELGRSQVSLVRSRLFATVSSDPKYLAWHETGDVATDDDNDGIYGLVGLLPYDIQTSETMTFRLMRDVGDSSTHDVPWLYIVHTDVPDFIVDEYNAWYDQEHLPRLVAVPGVERARRYMARSGNPRYLTAYELSDRDAFSSPEGLKARKTPWTEKMRSLFSNTRRLTCRLISDVQIGK